MQGRSIRQQKLLFNKKNITMKHHFIKTLLFAFLLFTPALQAQYLPLLEEGKQWSYYGNSTETVNFQGDSVVNGVVYKHLVGTHSMLLREDTATQQVFFFKDSTEYLLYDFSLELGDTLTIYSPFSELDSIPIFVEVFRVDTLIDMLNTSRKQIHSFLSINRSSPIGPTYLPINNWVEGIGGLDYYFSVTFYPSWVPDYHLLCAWKDSVHIYQQNSQNICYKASMSVDLNSSVNNTIKLYPNPANSVVVFTFDSEHMQIKSLTLHDMLGRKVLVKEYTSHSRTVELDVSALPSRMYSTRIEDSNGQVYVEKLIVEK